MKIKIIEITDRTTRARPPKLDKVTIVAQNIASIGRLEDGEALIRTVDGVEFYTVETYKDVVKQIRR
jgi:hypothetical protein